MRPRALALVAAVALLGSVTACGSTPDRARIRSGLANAVLLSCASNLVRSGTTSVATEVDPLAWRVSASGLTVSGDDRGSTSWSVSSGAFGLWRSGAISRFESCVDADPLDWSLARADGPFLRAELYPYYRNELMPCLARFGVLPGALPSAAAFRSDVDRFDPYTLVAAVGPDAARRIQRACPPAPLGVLAAVERSR